MATRPLRTGELLDGEGGYMVNGNLAPAEASLRLGTLPMGLARDVKLRNDVPAGEALRWSDVEVNDSVLAVRLRQELEQSARS
ncbi:SAF domain-containing protein [Saccharopolyspora thermophila]|uniref:SAF domain-containing protein n=1 Tax=Saccharopolyspora thermophila TaxID=89367 RepID=UPI001E2E132E|nr:SAF domain-containing protein [Saccharopolyspora subtropica]